MSMKSIKNCCPFDFSSFSVYFSKQFLFYITVGMSQIVWETVIHVMEERMATSPGIKIPEMTRGWLFKGGMVGGIVWWHEIQGGDVKEEEERMDKKDINWISLSIMRLYVGSRTTGKEVTSKLEQANKTLSKCWRMKNFQEMLRY